MNNDGWFSGRGFKNQRKYENSLNHTRGRGDYAVARKGYAYVRRLPLPESPSSQTMKRLLKNWLGITDIEEAVKSNNEMWCELLLHQDSYHNGFAVLKKHLNRPDKPLPIYQGKEIEQD